MSSTQDKNDELPSGDNPLMDLRMIDHIFKQVIDGPDLLGDPSFMPDTKPLMEALRQDFAKLIFTLDFSQKRTTKLMTDIISAPKSKGKKRWEDLIAKAKTESKNSAGSLSRGVSRLIVDMDALIVFMAGQTQAYDVANPDAAVLGERPIPPDIAEEAKKIFEEINADPFADAPLSRDEDIEDDPVFEFSPSFNAWMDKDNPFDKKGMQRALAQSNTPSKDKIEYIGFISALCKVRLEKIGTFLAQVNAGGMGRGGEFS